MKFPFVSSQNNLSVDNIGGNRYEPKSVLDIRRSPPSPLTGNSSDFNSIGYYNTVLLSSEEQLPVDNFENGMINHREEWDSDSLMRELGLYDDSTKSAYPLDLPELPPFFSVGFRKP